MAIWQLDTEKNADWLPSAFGYAWCNSYFVDRPDEASAQAVLDELVLREAHCLWRGTYVQYGCVRAGIGGPRPPAVTVYNQRGFRVPELHYASLFPTARLVGYSGGRLVWYKRWRGPLNPDHDFSGSTLTSAFITLLTDTLLTWLVETVGMVTRSGLPITSYAVDPRVYGWQMRDGGKRRERSPLTHP